MHNTPGKRIAGRDEPADILPHSFTNKSMLSNEVKTGIATSNFKLVSHLRIKKSNNVSFPKKYHLQKSMIMSTILDGCISLTLTAEQEKRFEAYENKRHRRLQKSFIKTYKTKAFVIGEIGNHVGNQETLLSNIKK